MPETASYPKIAQIAACGADVVTIKGSRQDVAEAALRQSAEIFYASHNWQPFFVEGTKTLAYELWEQLGFRAPDNVVVPLGYGSNVLGAERGFDELAPRGRDRAAAAALRRAGRPLRALRSRLPRRASSTWWPPRSRPPWRRASPPPSRRASPRCCARCATPAARRGGRGGGDRPRRCATSRRRGLYVEPTAAVAAAGLTRLLAGGRRSGPQENTVLVLTGSGLKASADHRRAPRARRAAPVEIKGANGNGTFDGRGVALSGGGPGGGGSPRLLSTAFAVRAAPAPGPSPTQGVSVQ